MITMIKRRTNAIEKMVKAMAHLPADRQVAILCMNFSISDLEEIADFQHACTFGGNDEIFEDGALPGEKFLDEK